jgi:protein-tyrosine phosphatase
MKVLVICSGNICRSPMAAEYLRHRAARGGLEHLVVDSAGTLGIEDAPASPEAIRTLREVGLDLSGHRSKGLTEADLQSSDLVIAMAGNHLEYLAAVHPGGRDHRLLLRAFERGPRPDPDAPDLADPIGQNVEVYRGQFGVIRTCVDHLVLHLRNLGPDPGVG